MITCPGYCGSTFAADDADTALKMLVDHLEHCARGNASVHQLRAFLQWVDETFPDHIAPEYHSDERYGGRFDDRQIFYDRLMEAYIEDGVRAAFQRARMEATMLSNSLKGGF